MSVCLVSILEIVLKGVFLHSCERVSNGVMFRCDVVPPQSHLTVCSQLSNTKNVCVWTVQLVMKHSTGNERFPIVIAD
jgi:hypothetical protein